MNILLDGQFGRLRFKEGKSLFFLCTNHGIINCTGVRIRVFADRLSFFGGKPIYELCR